MALNDRRVQPVGAYMLPIFIRQSAATAGGAVVWAMRNGAALKAFIRRIFLVASFDGTAAASHSQWEIERFTTATPTAGTAISVVKKKFAGIASTVADARFLDTGLTITGVVLDNPFMYVGNPRQNGATSEFVYPYSRDLEDQEDFTLDLNEGLAIKLTSAAVIGDSIRGYVEWDEGLR